MRGADQLHAAFGDRARGHRLGLGADLVDDDHLRHVVLDRFDHHAVLQRRDRRPACAGRARCPGCGTSPSPAISFEVSTITTRLRSSLSTRAHSRSIVVLPTPGRPSKQIDFPLRIDVEDDVDRAVDRAADAARQADDLPRAVADRADPMQRLLDAGAVVGAERREPRDDVRHVFVRHRRCR